MIEETSFREEHKNGLKTLLAEAWQGSGGTDGTPIQHAALAALLDIGVSLRVLVSALHKMGWVK